jgi:V/A-type H+-transporting ATPase subunit K
MNAIIVLLTAGAAALVLLGLYLHLRPLPAARARRLFRPTLTTSIALFLGGQLALVLLGVEQALAAPAVEAALSSGAGISTGMGLAFIGIGLPTAFSTVAAGVAGGPIGAASLAAVSEKPEIFGRTLVYLGLAEGIAIYGLVLSILMLNRV